MGFSPLKLQNPHKARHELSTAGAVGRAVKDGAQNLVRGVKAVALLPHNLKKQVYRSDKSKPVQWIDASRKAQRHGLRDQHKVERQAADDAEREVRMAVRLAIRTQWAVQAQAPAKAPLAAPHGAAPAPAQAEAIARVDAALTTYAQVLKGDKFETSDASEFDRVASMALHQLRDDRGISQKDYERFMRAGDGFSTESTADRNQRFSPFGGEADPVRRLCEATIGEAWQRLLEGQWGRQGDQQPMRVDAVVAWVQAHPAAPIDAPAEGAPGAVASRGKDIEDGAKQVAQRLLNLKDRLLGGERGGASEGPTPNGSGPAQEPPIEKSVSAATAPGDLEGGSSPKAAAQSSTPIAAIQQAVQDFVGLFAHPESTRLPDAPVRPEAVVEAPPVREPVTFTREEKLAQVDAAWATYGTVLGGEVPEGANTSLDAETLQRLASNAMLQLHDAGWITQADVARFNEPNRFITRETPGERAQRFIPGEAPNRVAARQLCEVAIGQAWARAYGVEGRSAPVQPFTIGEWRKRGAPAQAIAPTPLS